MHWSYHSLTLNHQIIFFPAAVASSRGLSAGSGVLDSRGNNSIKKGGPVQITISN